MPPTGFRVCDLDLWSRSSCGGVVGEVTADDVNAAEWRALLAAVGMASIEAVVPEMILLFFGDRSNVDVS